MKLELLYSANYAGVNRKHSALNDLALEWHMIGSLQEQSPQTGRNCFMWQTVDRISLLREIAKHDASAKILIQVNPLQIPNKAGCSIAEAEVLLEQGSKWAYWLRASWR